MKLEIELLKQISLNGEKLPYIVSSKGYIKNLNNKILKPQKINSGYYKIDIYINKKKKSILLHRLIAESFLPNKNNCKTVNHKNGNKLDCNLNNLEWASYSQNNKHAYDTKLKISLKGEESPFAKYKDTDIKIICKYLEMEESPKKIMLKTGYPLSLIKSIKSGLSWTHISKNYNIIQPRETLNSNNRKLIKKLYKEGFSINKILKILNLDDTKNNKKKIRRAIKSSRN